MRKSKRFRAEAAWLLLAAWAWGVQATVIPDDKVSTKDLETALASGNERLSDPDWLKRIEKKEYPFLAKYLHSPDPDVRTALTSLLLHINTPFCQKFYQELVHDSMFSIRVQAAQGLVKLDRKVKKEGVLAEFRKVSATQGDDRNALLGFLILALGNTGDKKIRDTLAAYSRAEQDPGVRSIYQRTLGRLGQSEALKEIEAELALPEPKQRKRALEKVEFLQDSAWAARIKPLLLDTTMVDSLAFVNRGFNARVCDYTVNTLARINPGKPFPFQVGSRLTYDAEQMRAARELYGLAAAPAAQPSPKPNGK